VDGAGRNGGLADVTLAAFDAVNFPVVPEENEPDEDWTGSGPGSGIVAIVLSAGNNGGSCEKNFGDGECVPLREVLDHSIEQRGQTFESAP
jgi:hypothetical protein